MEKTKIISHAHYSTFYNRVCEFLQAEDYEQVLAIRFVTNSRAFSALILFT